MKPLRVYIAGPYSASDRGEIEKNVAHAIDAGIQIFLRGHFPYVPHLSDLVDQRAKETGRALSWNDFIRWDRSWLELCDAILYLGKSNGADLELEEAKRLGKDVFHSVDEVPDLRILRKRHG